MTRFISVSAYLLFLIFLSSVRLTHACSCDCTYIMGACIDHPGDYCEQLNPVQVSCSGDGVDFTCKDGSTGCFDPGICWVGSFFCSSGICGKYTSYSLNCDEFVCGCPSGGGEEPPDCFVKQTQITMADGTKKNIEDVKAGEFIKTIKEDGTYIIDEVLAPEKSERYGFYTMVFEDGSILSVTENHPLWSKIGNYVGWGSLDPLMTLIKDEKVVERIKTGDQVYREDGTWATLMNTRYYPTVLNVYNLKLKGDEHTYLANGFLAHNKECETTAPDAPVLVAPVNGASCLTSNQVVLDWNAIANWGEDCDNENRQYKVYVNSALVATVDPSITSYTYSGTWGTVYNWYVQADNGPETRNSATWSFTLQACSRVVGRVWEDVNPVDAVFSGVPEAWSWNPPPAAGCSTYLSNNIIVRRQGTTETIASWGCNGSGSYYTTPYYGLPGGSGTLANYTLELLTPSSVDYPYAYVKWSYGRCTVAGVCNPMASASGTGNVASIAISDVNGMDWTNHLSWQITKNSPPSSWDITAAPGSHYFFYPDSDPADALTQDLIYVYPVSSSQTLTESVYDATSVISRVDVSKRAYNPANHTIDTAVSTSIGSLATACPPSTSCSINFSDNNILPGYYLYYPTVLDEIAISTGSPNATNQCTGNPMQHAGLLPQFADCDLNHIDQALNIISPGRRDELIVFGDRLPSTVGAISGPNQLYAYAEDYNFKYPESVGFYNFKSTDADGNAVLKQWSVSAGWETNAGAFPTITSIRIYAAGTPALGINPIMNVYAGDNSFGGARRLILDNAEVTQLYNTAAPNNTVWGVYPIAGPIDNVSSLDIVFTNDGCAATCFIEDRNLIIGHVEVTYKVSSDLGDTRTAKAYLYGYATLQNPAVSYYDAGSTAADTWFDGVDLKNLPVGTGPIHMNWPGALELPIPVRAGNENSGSYVLTATPKVAAPFYDGAPLTKSVAFSVPTYNTTGTMYLRDTSDICSLQDISANDKVDDGTFVRIKENSGATEVPLLNDETASGVFSILNVPLGYRVTPSTYSCLTCSIPVQVCMDQKAGDDGVYVSACSQIPPTPGVDWSSTGLCSPVLPTPPVADGVTVTTNLGFDLYNNEKWSTVLDGDIYAPRVDFDIAVVPGDAFSPNLINRRKDIAPLTVGGFTFVELAGGIQLNNSLPEYTVSASEFGGFAEELFPNSSYTYSSQDKWLAKFAANPPSNANVIVGMPSVLAPKVTFTKDRVYVNTADQFESWFNNPANVTYSVPGMQSIVLIYVTGEDTRVLHIDKSLRRDSVNMGMVVITDLAVEIDEYLGILEAMVDQAAGTYTVNACSINDLAVCNPYLTTGFLDMTILTTKEIVFTSKYDAADPATTHDLAIMVGGSLISKDTVKLNRDLWHMSNSKYPAEMVRYYEKIIPQLMELENSDEDIQGITGLSVYDIYTPYEE